MRRNRYQCSEIKEQSDFGRKHTAVHKNRKVENGCNDNQKRHENNPSCIDMYAKEHTEERKK